MSSDLRKTILNTRERWTSTKYNKQVQISDRNLQETIRHLQGADVDLSGVVNGLIAAVNAGTMQITVGRGLALLFDSSKVAPDSQYRWIEIESGEVVTVPAADPTNPRWDVIEIAPGVASTGSLSRDIFDPTLGTFTSQNVSVEEIPNPVVQVRSGTAAANPAFPAGTSGQIPLAYILVPAAAGSLPTDGLVHCRPILRAPGALDVASDAIGGLQDENVRGGGVYVDTASTLNFLLQKATGRWKGHRMAWGIEWGTLMTFALNMYDGVSLPASDACVYVYAAEPPYPSGYGALAGREFNINGATAAAEFVSARQNTKGCLVITSTLPPNTESIQGEQVFGGSVTLKDPPFGGTALLPRDELVYLGAFDYDQTAGEIKTQQVRGSKVVPTERTSGDIWDLSTGSGTAGSLWGPTAGSFTAGISPVTAQVCHCLIRNSLNASTHISLTFNDDADQSSIIQIANTSVANPLFHQPVVLYPDKVTGNVTLSWANNTGSGMISDPTMFVVAYEDCILARR